MPKLMLRASSPRRTPTGALMMTKITKGLNGIRRHKKKEGEAINMSKTKEDLQEPDKNLSQFYEQLFEAFHLYTPLDPKAAENQRMINAFVSQPQGNIFSKA
jgi:hypothetical protein